MASSESNTEQEQSVEVDFLHPLACLYIKKSCRPPVSTGDLYDYYQTVYLNKNGHHVIISNAFELYDYDVACDTWSALCDHEIPVSKFGLAVHQSQLHLIGGKIRGITESPTEQEDSDKIWYLDDKLGWLESSMSPMPNKVSGAVGVVKDGLFIVVGASATLAYPPHQLYHRRTITLDAYQDGKWLATRYFEEIGCVVNNMQLAIYEDHLYFAETVDELKSGTYKCRKRFHSLAISDFSESKRSDVHFNIDRLEPDYGMSDMWTSNLVSFGGFLIAIALSKDEGSLALYTYQNSGNWKMELFIYLSTSKPYPTNHYPIRVVALSRQIMVITNDETFMVSFKAQPYCLSSKFSYRSLKMLELAGIPVLTQLKEKKLLHQFKTQAGFNLQVLYGLKCDPVKQHIWSWMRDNKQRELIRKPTWGDLTQVLKEIGLGELVKDIEAFFADLIPTKDAGIDAHTNQIVNEIAALQKQLELLHIKINEIEDPTLQLSIREKVDTCRGLCSSVFRRLGEERQGYKDTIKELQHKIKCQSEAAAVPQVTQPEPTPPTIQPLLKELYNTVANKWEDIGILLGIEDGQLAKVKADYPMNSGSCLREMLRIWLKKVEPQPLWTDLIDSLNALGEEKLAQQLRKRYCL